MEALVRFNGWSFRFLALVSWMGGGFVFRLDGLHLPACWVWWNTLRQPVVLWRA